MESGLLWSDTIIKGGILLKPKLTAEETDERVLYHAGLIIDKGLTVREAEKISVWSRTTIDMDVSVRLPQINTERGKEARTVLDQHYSERCIRGGIASGQKKKLQRMSEDAHTTDGAMPQTRE